MAEKKWKLLTLRCGACKVLVNEDLDGWATETCEGHKERMREAGAEMSPLPHKLSEVTVTLALLGVMMGAGKAEDLGVFGSMEEALAKATGELSGEDWASELSGLAGEVELIGKEEGDADKGTTGSEPTVGFGATTKIEEGESDGTGTIAAE